jgi:predicted dehydrogenase
VTGTDTVGVAVVGAGYWGPNLVRNVQACEATRLRWVCDLDLRRSERLAAPYTDVRATTRLDDVLNDDHVEAVMVATPAATHHAVAMAALHAGKHVLVEKPLASTYADGLALVEEAERRGLTIMCDHTYCYTPAVRRIREFVAAGELGDIQYVDSVRINLGLVQHDVDVLWDLAPHDLSILDFILPEDRFPLAVSAHGADPIGAGHSCVAYLTLNLAGGAIAHAHVNWLSPTKIRTTIVGGSKRTLVWDDLNPSQRLSIYDRGVDLSDPAELGAEARRETLVSYRSGDMVAPALDNAEPLQAVVQEFVASIQGGRPPATDGRSGLRVLDVLESATRSLAFAGSAVPLRTTR